MPAPEGLYAIVAGNAQIDDDDQSETLHKTFKILAHLLSRFTCEECIEGLEWVGAHMTDPLWVAEYVVYLQQQWCTDPRCHDAVATHFPAMHAMAMEQFWDATATCNQYAQVCGATKPPTEKPSA